MTSFMGFLSYDPKLLAKSSVIPGFSMVWGTPPGSRWYSETGSGIRKLVFRNWKDCIRKLRVVFRNWKVVFGGLAPEENDMEAQILCTVFAREGGGF